MRFYALIDAVLFWLNKRPECYSPVICFYVWKERMRREGVMSQEQSEALDAQYMEKLKEISLKRPRKR